MSFAQMPGGDAALLSADARRRMAAGDAAGARDLLERASRADPHSVEARLDLALACRALDDHPAALAALDEALVLNPTHFVALLAKGATLERLGAASGAASVYATALKLAPFKAPAQLEAPLARAKEVVATHAIALERHLRQELTAQLAAHPAADLERFEECLRIYAGTAKAHVQAPELFTFPRLPAIPFLDDAHFPWLAKLEAATDRVRAEAERVMLEDWSAFHPYVRFAKGEPLMQWEELNHSAAWSSFDLWRHGAKVEANCVRCPETVALLENLPLASQPGVAPNAMFSVLAPHTRIPAHTGSANTRVVAHLPLVLPEGCGFRVGNDSRLWRLGKAWVFDDTIEHEAWNDSDQVRVILIIDLWNPLLTETERTLVNAMMNAKQSFRWARR